MKQINFITRIVFILLFSVFSHAQLQNANWYFGQNQISSQNGAGLDFNNGNVSVLTDGKTEDDRFFTSTMSDENGNLLFYTDGYSVWNKNHIKMPNGNNTLNGIFHTVSIVPFPGNSDKYYVFTIGSVGNEHRYFYSIVDMNLNNNLGDVETATLNTPLNLLPYFDGVNIKNHMQRKNNMSVAKHSDGESYWLILNPFDVFFVLKIDINGISSNPIVYDENIPSINYSLNILGQSGMSISPSMDKVAYFTKRLNGGNVSIALTILNFDNSNGQLSSFYFEIDSNQSRNGISCEFSSNGQFLYILEDNASLYNIFQLDLQNLSNPSIFLGFSIENSFDNASLPTLIRGIDGKIYVPNSSNFLGVINNPNLLGTNSNYVNNQINLGADVIAKKLPQQVCSHNTSLDCPDNLTITQTVLNGTSDIREANSWIVALNIVENGASAEYDANKFVKLQTGFHARAGSYFRGYIDGCTNTLPIAKTSISNIKKEVIKELKIYPNPAKDKVNLAHSYLNIQSYALYDMHGRKVSHQSAIKNTKHTIDVSNFEKGLYILNITIEDNAVITKHLILN